MESIEGKEGFRIYKNREDAENLAKLDRSKKTKKIIKVKITDSEKAQNEGFTIHNDISIAANTPENGDEGWIVLKDKEKEDYLKKILEIRDIFTINQ